MNLQELTEELSCGGVALVATDTVYGLAALPGSKGYDRIFEMKNREKSQVLPWLVSSAHALEELALQPTSAARSLAAMFWPGPLTLVVKASPQALAVGPCAKDGTVALRMPDEPSLLHLLEALDSPLACTSANIHGQPSPARFDQVPHEFAELPRLDGMPSSTAGSVASCIVDCTGPVPKLLRDGIIKEHVVLEVASLLID